MIIDTAKLKKSIEHSEEIYLKNNNIDLDNCTMIDLIASEKRKIDRFRLLNKIEILANTDFAFVN